MLKMEWEPPPRASTSQPLRRIELKKFNFEEHFSDAQDLFGIVNY